MDPIEQEIQAKGLTAPRVTPANLCAMPPFQQRVLQEAWQLRERLLALRSFINGSSLFAGLSPDERARLHRQEQAMTAYLTVLQERIEAFGDAST